MKPVFLTPFNFEVKVVILLSYTLIGFKRNNILFGTHASLYKAQWRPNSKIYSIIGKWKDSNGKPHIFRQNDEAIVNYPDQKNIDIDP